MAAGRHGAHRQGGPLRVQGTGGTEPQLRFRYPGTATIRGATAGVHLRVRATSSMGVDRKRVVNGEAVTFTGRIRGEAVPSGGKLLQLQVFSRGSWLTFATPRTDARGRWQHDYRFTATEASPATGSASASPARRASHTTPGHRARCGWRSSDFDPAGYDQAMPRGGLAATPDLLAYLGRYGARTDDVLDRVRAETAEMPAAQMQVTADQGALIELLVKLIGAKDALEVGTFTGYSAICIARGLGENGRLTCLELDPERAAIARANLDEAGVGERVEILVGPAGESLEAMAAVASFDFAFIDADKTGYPEYYELVLQRMRPGGLILLDNMLQGGGVLTPESENARVIDELNQRIHDDERVDMAMTISADGLTFVRVR